MCLYMCVIVKLLILDKCKQLMRRGNCVKRVRSVFVGRYIVRIELVEIVI